MVELRSKVDGSSLYAFSTHLSNLIYEVWGRRAQEVQAEIMVRLIDDFCGRLPDERRARILIMGDLNSTRSDGATPVLVREGYIDASQTGDKPDDTPTLVGFQSGYIWQNIAQYRERCQVDFIFSSPDLTQTMYRVHAGQYRNKCCVCPRYLSDHRALSVEISFPIADVDAAGLARLTAADRATTDGTHTTPESPLAPQQAPREVISL